METEEVQVVTVAGDPRIPEARMGATVFTAGAKSEIRFRPVPAEEGQEAGAEKIQLNYGHRRQGSDNSFRIFTGYDLREAAVNYGLRLSF